MNFFALLLPFVALFQPAAPRVDVKLIPGTEALVPGTTTPLIVDVTLEKDWHTYYPITIDTGMPTALRFTVPPGISVGTLQWPTPHLDAEGELEYLGLEGTFRVLTELTVADDVAYQSAAIDVTVDALVCQELCVPVTSNARLVLPVDAGPAKLANQNAFEEARAALPAALEKAPHIAGSRLSLNKTRVGINEEAALEFHIHVADGLHIQDRKPSSRDFIPSRVFVETVPGLKFGDAVWPKPKIRMSSLGPMRELAGDFTVSVPVQIIDEQFLSGPVQLRTLFRYQACNEAGTCFPEEYAHATLTLNADTPFPYDANAPVRGTVRPVVEFDDALKNVAASAAGHTNPTPTPPVTGAANATTDTGLQAAADAIEAEFTLLTAADWEEHIPWFEWYPGIGPELSRRGYMVYVDYTATWCATCQTNKVVALERPETRGLMADLDVIPIEADFTRKNPQMLKEILSWRPSVPVNVIYMANHPDEPVLLPPLLTPTMVRDYLAHPEQYLHTETTHNLWVVLAFGFLGGLILNVMPCVLPVISLKVLSFVQQAGEDRGRIFRLGLAFAAGILVWFWIFAFLSKAGELPWQYPEVNAAIGAVLLILTLNLFGVFEIALPGATMGGLSKATAREGYSGAFMKGLLATLLGTACTAPFLAGAVIYASTQPLWIALLVFTAAGVGMASPYLLLSANPAWTKFIPKPGNWMVTFKQAAGFVLLATVVWLLTILADQIDTRGIAWTIAFYCFLGLAAWLIGKTPITWEFPPRLALWVASVAIAFFGLWFCLSYMYDWPKERGWYDAPPAVKAPAAPGTARAGLAPGDLTR